MSKTVFGVFHKVVIKPAYWAIENNQISEILHAANFSFRLITECMPCAYPEGTGAGGPEHPPEKKHKNIGLLAILVQIP